MPQAVILTALPVEYLAVRAHLTHLQEETHPQGTIYERGKFAANGQTWSVGIVEIGAGNPGAALEAERSIAHFKPDVIFFVGVAGGIKDVKLGDVVASTKIYGYEFGKVEQTFKPRPELGLASYGLEQRARAEARKPDWRQRLFGVPNPAPRVLVAPIAAGEKVIASTEAEVFQFLRSNYGDAVAVEMEGLGFLEAARANQRVSAIVIRGISDLIDGKAQADRSGSQEIAADHASAFVFEVLANLKPTHESGAGQPNTIYNTRDFVADDKVMGDKIGGNKSSTNMSQQSNDHAKSWQTIVQGGTAYVGEIHIHGTTAENLSSNSLDLPIEKTRRWFDWEVSDTVDRIIQEHKFFVSRPEQDQIDRFLSEHHSGLLLVKASAGYGKTSLLANWIIRQQDNYYFIVRHFFNRGYETHSLVKAYQHLLGQLYKYFEYFPESVPESEVALRSEIYQLLRNRDAKADRPLVIVLDALDEAEDLLKPLPLSENVFVIVSARADKSEEPEYLRSWMEHSPEVICLERLPREAIIEWLQQSSNDQLIAFSENNHFIDRLNEITEGFPLYLNYLIEELGRAAKQRQDVQSLLEQMPVGFGEYVKQQLRHLDKLGLSDQRWQFFALLTVAKGVLEKEDIKTITGMRDRDLRKLQDYWQVTRWIRNNQNKFYIFTHPALRAAFAQQLGDEAEDALNSLIAYCSKWQEHQSSYAFQHYIDHLRDTERWNKLSELTGNSKFIQAAFNHAASTGNATTISEFLLKNAHQLLNIAGQKVPLKLLRTGNLDEALFLLELYEPQPELYILWHLLLIWELKATGQIKVASKISEQLLKKRLTYFSRSDSTRWRYNIAVYLLVNIFELDLENFHDLSRHLLSEDDFSWMCILLCRRGYYVEAFEIKRAEIERKLINNCFKNLVEIDQILRIVEIQAESIGKETALESCSKIAELLLVPDWELCFAAEWAKLAKLYVSLDKQELGRKYFRKAVDIANKIQSSRRKAQEFLSIIYYQKEAGKNNSVFLEDAIELLQSNNLKALDTSGLYSKVRFSVEIAEIQALLSRQEDAEETLKEIEIYAGKIEDFTEKIRCFLEIGKAYLKIGELEHAFQIADRNLRNNFSHERSEFLAEIAHDYFEIGNIDSAWQTVNLAEEQWYKDDILSHLAWMRANQLDFDNAFEIIRQIQDKYRQESALSNVTRVQIQKSSQDGIGEQNISNHIEQISNQSEQSKLWLTLAEQQLDIKNFAAAQKTVNRIQDQEEQRLIPKLFATAYAEAGNFEQAVKLVDQIDDAKIQAETLQTIALIQIEADKHEAARNTLASLFTVQQGPELQTLKTCTLSKIADIQIKSKTIQEALTTVESAERHLRQIKNRFIQAQLLADLARQWWKLGDIQKSQNSFQGVLRIAQAIREEQEKKGVWSAQSGCSYLFAIVAETQARIGNFHAALETVEKIIHDSALKANVLRTIAQELSKLETKLSYQEKLKNLLNATYEEVQANPFSSIMNNRLQVFCTLAVTESIIDSQQAALETLSCLREQVQGKDRAQILAHVAIAEIEIKGIDAAVETSKDIEDPSQCLKVLWEVAKTQFNRGLKIELLETLAVAHQKYDLIKDEKQRTSAMKHIAGIQMMAGSSEQAIQTLERIPESRDSMLSILTRISADAGDLKTFKHLLIPCTYHIDIAYEGCSCLAKLYPEKAIEIARIVDKDY